MDVDGNNIHHFLCVFKSSDKAVDGNNIHYYLSESFLGLRMREKISMRFKNRTKFELKKSKKQPKVSVSYSENVL